MKSTQAGPPVARQQSHVTTCHGHRREDPWAWLRDENWQQAMLEPERLKADIRACLEAENAWTEQQLAPVASLRKRLVRELRGRLREDDSSVPLPDGPWAYYQRYREGGQHPLLCRQPVNGGEEEVLIDGDAEAQGLASFHLGAAAHSPDHRYVAWAVDTTGAESWLIRIRDLHSGEDLPDVLEQARGDMEWAADSHTLFYTWHDESHRPRRVYRHQLATAQAADTLVYEEPDPGFFVGVDSTPSRRYLVIESHDHTTSEVRLIDAGRPTAEPQLVMPRQRDVEYEIADHGEGWIVHTNAGDAEDYRIVYAPSMPLDPSQWRDIVPHRPGRLIQGMLVFRDWLVWQVLEDAEPRLYVRAFSDGQTHEVAFEDVCHDIGIAPGFEYATDTLRLARSSFTTPHRVYDYDMRSRELNLRKEQQIPSGHDPDNYIARRVFATASDGEPVPVSLFYHRSTQPGPDTPLLLNGYGAYGISDLPGFSPHRLSLVDRGFVYAIAHVRGGQERGYRWYREGKLQHKANTFSDFIACAEHLIDQGYTGKGRICALGGSAGGMLVGAVINQRPALFHAAVADVPFVDVLNTMLDPSLPLTPPEWPEWGNPIEDPEAYHNILSWSPYDNVQPQHYPHLLVTAGVSDPRVTYWEPAKWVAKLRATAPGERQLLLYTDMRAGHGGPGGRFDFLEEVALRYAFILMVYGLSDVENQT